MLHLVVGLDQGRIMARVIHSGFGPHPSMIAVFRPAQTNRTKGGTRVQFNQTKQRP